MRLGGIYNMEPLFNFHWAFMALAILRLYHYLVLQPLSFLTEVNLSSIMCPAISDPFAGPWYRLAANIHQTLFFILHGKIYCFLGNKFFAPSATSAALAAEYYNIMRKVSETYRNGSKNGGNNKFKIVNCEGETKDGGNDDEHNDEDNQSATSSSASISVSGSGSIDSDTPPPPLPSPPQPATTTTETIRARNGNTTKDESYLSDSYRHEACAAYVNATNKMNGSSFKED